MLQTFYWSLVMLKWWRPVIKQQAIVRTRETFFYKVPILSHWHFCMFAVTYPRLSKADHSKNKHADYISRQEYRVNNTISEHVSHLCWCIQRRNELQLYTRIVILFTSLQILPALLFAMLVKFPLWLGTKGMKSVTPGLHVAQLREWEKWEKSKWFKEGR